LKNPESTLPTYRRSVIPTRPGAETLPLVAIVGRPNVGKSTLFNRLTKSRRSIVGDEPGITRDRIYGEFDWAGRRFRLVDTGGIVPDDPELIPTEIYNQAKVALDEAQALILVVDARTELARPDYDLARLLTRGSKPVFLAVNKVEGEAMALEAENFRRLGIRNLYSISAEHGLGIGDLLDAVTEAIPTTASDAIPETADEIAEEAEISEGAPLEPGKHEPTEEPAQVHRTHGEFEQHETAVAIIGRPNVGKSTLLNALTGTSRAIVSPIAGTTRDAVDEAVEFEGGTFRFVDTAGIRRKGKTHLMAEKLSVVMARRHLEAADVALLVIDATEGVTASDATIGGYAHESGRSVIIIVNKWDAVTTGRTDGKPPADREIFERQLRRALKYLDYAPVIFLSALEGKGVGRVFKEVKAIATERRKRITTGQMNRFLEKIDFQRAPVPMSKRIRIFYMTQAAVAPPTFVLFTDRDVRLHFAFERFLENQIREAFGFKGTPIWFKVKARNEKKDL
jgi:GTP-binding protein